MKSEELYEVKLYLGQLRSRMQEGFQAINYIRKGELANEIGKFQDSYEGMTIPVRITDTTFVSGQRYSENGWEVAAISYPKIEQSHEQTLKFMLDLGDYLLGKFLQNRICVLDNYSKATGRTYMLEP
jgi:hypothetical protein